MLESHCSNYVLLEQWRARFMPASNATYACFKDHKRLPLWNESGELSLKKQPSSRASPHTVHTVPRMPSAQLRQFSPTIFHPAST